MAKLDLKRLDTDLKKFRHIKRKMDIIDHSCTQQHIEVNNPGTSAVKMIIVLIWAFLVMLGLGVMFVVSGLLW